jgi:hypothetical protein
MKTNFEEITIRQEISRRGGGIEISLDFLGNEYEGKKMTAYQNYLGGGLLGRVESDCNAADWRNDAKLMEVSEELKEYFFNITNPEGEWESQTFEQNQNMPLSAY